MAARSALQCLDLPHSPWRPTACKGRHASLLYMAMHSLLDVLPAHRSATGQTSNKRP